MRRRSKSLPITIPGKEQELREQRLQVRNAKARVLFSAPFIAMPLLKALSEMSDEEETTTETSTQTSTESIDTTEFPDTVFEIDTENIETTESDKPN